MFKLNYGQLKKLKYKKLVIRNKSLPLGRYFDDSIWFLLVAVRFLTRWSFFY